MGKGIYLASEHAKSAGYVFPGSRRSGGWNAPRTGIMFLVQAALGKMHTIHDDDWRLTQPPSGALRFQVSQLRVADKHRSLVCSADVDHDLVCTWSSDCVQRDGTIDSACALVRSTLYSRWPDHTAHAFELSFAVVAGDAVHDLCSYENQQMLCRI